jgi:general secretion pathway protein N
MKLPPLRRALPAAALFLVFLAITLPAVHVLGWFGGGRLAATGVEGTAWSGRAERLAVDGFALGPVVWQWRPLALFAGRIEYQLFAQSGTGGGELRLGRGLTGALSARAAQLTLPAAEVGRQLRIPLVTLAGDFQIDVAELVFAGGWIESLDGRIVWQGAQLLQPSPLSLGTLTMQLGLRDGNIVGTLGDQGGPLELGGDFTLGADRAYRLDALLKPRGDADPQLRQALGLLGNPDAQGRYRLQYSGAL